MTVTMENTFGGEDRSRYNTNAGILGFKPGRLPRQLQTTLGNQRELVHAVNTLTSAIYLQEEGVMLEVFNR